MNRETFVAPARVFLLLACVVFLIGYGLHDSTYFIGGGASGKNSVINNLRQIAGAKDQLALEKGLQEGYVVSNEDLVSYLKNATKDQLVQKYGSEKYVLNPIGTDPYAVLESDWWTRWRPFKPRYLVGTNGTVFRLP